MEQLRGRAKALRGVPVSDRIGGIARAASWLLEHITTRSGQFSATQATMESELAEWSGYSRPVIRQGLVNLLSAMNREELERWWAASAGSTSADLLAIIAAGNIPGVAITPIAGALMAGIPVIVKASTAEPLVAAWWHEALRETSPELAEAMAVVCWVGGNTALEDSMCGLADRVVVYGSDATVAELTTRYGPRIHGFGTGISAAFVAPGADPSAAAHGFAQDIAMWDQQGCLSPRGLFVVGANADADRFGSEMRSAMEEITTLLPPGRRSFEDSARLRLFRADQEARIAAGEGNRIWMSRETLDWTLVVEPGPGFEPSPLDRTVVIWPLTGIDQLERALAPWRDRLQGVALAARPAEEAEWRARLLAIGFSHVARPGQLQAPPVDWRNRGHDLLPVFLGPPVREGSHES